MHSDVMTNVHFSRVTEGFEKLTGPEHVQLLDKIKAHGGPESYQHDDGALRDLIEGWIQDSPTKADYRASFEDLKKGLFEDLKATVEKNADHVEAKLTLQRKQLERIDEQTALMVATFRGLGGKIFDPVITLLWIVSAQLILRSCRTFKPYGILW